MDFNQSVKSVFSQYATFSGRASRSEYWWFYLFAVLASLVLRIVDGVLRLSIGIEGLGLIFTLAVLVPHLAVATRRLHDSGRSGWWVVGPVGGGLVAFAAFFFGAVGLAVTVSSVPSTSPGGLVALAVVGGLAALGIAVTRIVLLTRPSAPADNQYGPPPPHVLPTSPYAGTAWATAQPLDPPA